MNEQWVAVRRAGDAAVVAYDPCSAQTLQLDDRSIGGGRQRLSNAVLATATPVHPRALSRIWPVSVCWSPIVTCNLSCPHCLDDKSVAALSRAHRHAIAGVLAATDVMGVDISGGEPLLLGDLPVMLDTLRTGGLAVSVTTNGWRLAARIAELAGRVDALRVSLDGPDAARHDAWRGSGSFARALAGIDAAVAAGVPVQIQTVLMTDTAGGLADLVALAARHGARGVTALQMLPIGHGATLAAHQALSDERAQRLIDGLRAPPVPVRLRRRDDAEHFTVVRADGRIWRNGPAGRSIAALHSLAAPHDLRLDGTDGSA